MVGAGAAGLMAALFAARGAAPVILIERTRDGGRKILISGGGRCNVLPSVLAPERFVTDSPPHLMRGMLRAWPLAAQRAFFEEDAGIPLALEDETGKLFPRSNRARDVRDALIVLARRTGVEFRFGVSLTGLARDADRWRLNTTAGPLQAGRVILATGGLSVPATGSDGTGLALTRELGHRIHPTYPALTPLLCANPAPLAGLSLPVRLRARHAGRTVESRGGFLFTHRGYSGPAVLDVSHVFTRAGAENGAHLRVSWSPLPPHAWDERLRAGDRFVTAIVSAELPDRLATYVLGVCDVPRDRRTSALTRGERTRLIDALTGFDLPWSGHEGYKKAEVTGGGVALDEVDPRTLASLRHPGLYICGEMLDAFGPIGGHNFAWAWSTGRAAGLAAAASARLHPDARDTP